MTRKDALAELIAKVEAGELTLHGHKHFYPLSGVTAVSAFAAYHGSLDAAKALHEAVLPKMFLRAIIQRGRKIFEVTIWPNKAPVSKADMVTGRAKDPARAWLLAILRALHSMETDT